jgi:hypothetical protein
MNDQADPPPDEEWKLRPGELRFQPEEVEFQLPPCRQFVKLPEVDSWLCCDQLARHEALIRARGLLPKEKDARVLVYLATFILDACEFDATVAVNIKRGSEQMSQVIAVMADIDMEPPTEGGDPYHPHTAECHVRHIGVEAYAGAEAHCHKCHCTCLDVSSNCGHKSCPKC